MSKVDNQEEEKMQLREYHRQRYLRNQENLNAYRRSCRVKAKQNISEEEFKKYGSLLADVLVLRKIIQTIPREFITECLEVGSKQ
jgi:hypothetical protein